MNMASFCKNKGFTLDQYNQFKTNINATAQAILDTIKLNYVTDTGMYYDTNSIINFESNNDTKGFIIQALKKLDVEFRENNSLWRY